MILGRQRRLKRQNWRHSKRPYRSHPLEAFHLTSIRHGREIRLILFALSNEKT